MKTLIFLIILLTFCFSYQDSFSMEEAAFQFSSIQSHHAEESGPFIFSEEVVRGRLEGKAIVALESTVISHGLPFPHNFETAKEIEHIVRSGGAVPATIAILRGKIHIGLNETSLLELSQIGNAAVKTSRRDIAVVVGTGKTGATTVSATSLLAHKAGIQVFVTGGIGGVHRGVEETMDISADLTELGKTPVAVVCAGVKSILDIGRTLEYLETQGVPVIGYQTNEFPAFFTARSGYGVSARLDTPEEVAKAIHANGALQLHTGMVIAVPIDPHDAADGQSIESATQQALNEAKQQGISGRQVTPFILERVNQLTKGDSLRANMALLKHNAQIGTKIAVTLKVLNSKIDNVGGTIVIGGAVYDIIAKPTGSLIAHTSNPGTIEESWGGVARNIAEVLARLGANPLLMTAIGNDADGITLIDSLTQFGLSTQGIYRTHSRTAKYNAVLNEKGELVAAVADMDIFNSLTPQWIAKQENTLASATVIVVDSNLPQETIMELVQLAQRNQVQVWLEPTSIPKSLKSANPKILSGLTYISPNLGEMKAMVSHLSMKDRDCQGVEQCAALACELVQHGVHHVILKMGPDGVALVSNSQDSKCDYHYLKAPNPPQIISVTGAGDSLVGATVWALTKGKDIKSSLTYGLKAAELSLVSPLAVSNQLSVEALEN
eukprot:TRINITY_DN5160_c0_g1_i2.p1 TRINITY_DN5160_c0_g1~~TRINITY_DN5160_c0_g1_i2.p1  ORF type:complete len:665 (+),score=151.36 TRINITY_DN5160_c0_g1_i2:56-2050(+)